MAKNGQETNDRYSPLSVGVNNEGFDGGPLPDNPADKLRYGPLRQRQFPTSTGRHAFSIPTKPPLHFNDGPDGAAESFSSRTVKGEERGTAPGTDPNKYSQGSNTAFTDRGEPIRGT